MAGTAQLSDAVELAAAFDAGTLVRPDPTMPNLVDVARAMPTASGVGGLGLSPFADDLAASLADREHLVLVLADGLGLETLEREPGARTLRDHLHSEVRGVFPSSTAVALTSIATGEWPARHAVTGWWTHIEQIGGPATILQYRRLADDRLLDDLGVTPEEAFPIPSLVPQVGRRCHFLMPREIAGSVYSRYWTGGAAATGYESLTGTFNSIVEAVAGADGPTFTYVYIPLVDKEAHQAGPESVGARGAIGAIDRLVADLKARLGDSAAVVVTADHGHLAVADGERFIIQEADGIPGLLASHLRATLASLSSTFGPASTPVSRQGSARTSGSTSSCSRPTRSKTSRCSAPSRWRHGRGSGSATSPRSREARACWASTPRWPPGKRFNSDRTTPG